MAVRIPRWAARGTTQLLNQLACTSGVFTGSVQQGFAEGIAVSLLPDTHPLLSAHVLVLLLEVRAKPKQSRPPRGAVILFQPTRGTNDNHHYEKLHAIQQGLRIKVPTHSAASMSSEKEKNALPCLLLLHHHHLHCPPTSPILEETVLGQLIYLLISTFKQSFTVVIRIHMNS